MSKHIWGIDLGGTKIEGVVFDNIQNLEPISRLRVPTNSQLGYESILNSVKELIDNLSKEVNERPTFVGFGTPGVCDPQTGLQKNSNTLCLNGKPLKEDLRKKLEIQVELANDANCFALSEAMMGAGRGAECVFGVIMGTGVGGGLVFQGKARYGCHGIAGEWGHNVLDPEGPDCYCGKKGCVEQIISGPALQKFYEDRAGVHKGLSEIFSEESLEKDPIARETKERLLKNFGRAISTLINVIDPEVIVIGGGVSKQDFLYTEGLDYIRKNVFNDSLKTKIVKHQLGDSAGVFGAALLA